MRKNKFVHIIGAGLAGSEAAWTLAQAGFSVILHEMRPEKTTQAHKTEYFAELVCSNSFRSDDALNNAVGLLHAEMRLANSLIMQCADNNKVPAGGALAVDRDKFAAEVTHRLTTHPNITVEYGEIDALPPENWGNTIIATGPLTSKPLTQAIQNACGEDSLSFYDAIAPILYKNSINMNICWFQSRYDKIGPGGTGKDYINCPLNKEQYYAFIDALIQGEQTEFHSFEKAKYFDGCLPIEVMAQRGKDTLRHGPMKPRGLTNAHQKDIKPYAVVQLRQDNALGTLYNIVGFQTKLKHKAQIEIFRKIPGLENAEFARLGGIHRNTYLNSPCVLHPDLRLKAKPYLRFAGQITGCEGYIESASTGLIAALLIIQEEFGKEAKTPPITSALGALLNHITLGHRIEEERSEKYSFQPMNINFGLFPPLEDTILMQTTKRKKTKNIGENEAKSKKQLLAERALKDIQDWLNEIK